MKKWSLIWISALALLSPLAMASPVEEKNAEVAPGIYFSKLPVITDMTCGETQLLEYTVTNNISVAVRVNQAIQDLQQFHSINPISNVFISGGTCGVNPSFTLDAGNSCTIDVTVTTLSCPVAAKKGPPGNVQVREALVLVPSTTVQRNPLTSIIQLNIVQGPTIAGLTAYIANDDESNIVTLCPVNLDGSLGDNFGECTPLSDGTFNIPEDVIVSPKAAFTGGVTMAYVANAGNNTISVCPVNQDGTFGYCKTPAFTDLSFNFGYTGLRLSADLTTLYVTNYWSNTISTCPVNLDGTLSGACTAYAGLPNTAPFNGPNGRIVVNLANTHTYVPNYGNNSVSICDSAFASCTYDSDSNFNDPIGLDMDVTGSYVFAANSGSTVASCKVTAAGLAACNISDGDGTISNSGDVTNLYMQNYNGYGYIPNDDINTVSICPVSSSTGKIGTQISPDLPCTTAYGSSDLGFTEPASVWIADLSPQLLYVGNNHSPTSASTYIEVFSLPLTSVSTPVTTVRHKGSAAGFAFDNFGNLFVADNLEGTVDTFTLPLTHTSTPSATFTPPDSPNGVTFDDMGRLFVSMENGNIAVYNTPGTLSFTLLGAEDQEPYQMAFDSDGNLNVADCNGYIQVYQPPFFNNQTPNVTVSTPSNVCVQGAVVVEGNFGEVLTVTASDTDMIFDYQLPLPSGAPITITVPGAKWGYNLAVDSYLNGYVPDITHHIIDVFGPFDSTVATSRTLPFTPGGVAVQQ